MVLDLHTAKRYEDVIRLIEAALLQGQSQPWMYEVLALTMEVVGRPKEEVERVLLSTVDFTAVDVPSMLYSAAYMTRFGRTERALELYRQASNIDPLRSEPYVLGLKLARQAKDVDAIEWAATGILQRAWTENHADLHQAAELAAADAETLLRRDGNFERLEQFQAAMAEARQRDLVVKLTWSGDADLDLIVEEPLGTICSFDNPYSRGGGVLVHDGYGPRQKDTYDLYVCPFGAPGDYRITIRYSGGNVVAKQALLTIIRYQGTSKEVVRTIPIEVTREDRIFRISLHQGRRKELGPAPAEPLVEQAAWRDAAPQRPRTLLQMVGHLNAGSRTAGDRFQASRVAQPVLEDLRRGARVGFQPIVQAIPEGTLMNAGAVVSADRRYVRLSVFPQFSVITDVFTFSFANFGE